APLVQSDIAIGEKGPELNLPKGNIAKIVGPNPFRDADGIVGLAYAPLDIAKNVKLNTQQEIQPWFTQLVDAGLTENIFSLYTLRSVPYASKDGALDHDLNNGLLILGGGEECTDLYTGSFETASIVHDKFYNTNLLSVQVGNQPAIEVDPGEPTDFVPSNSIIDSGTNSLVFETELHNAIISTFRSEGSQFVNLINGGRNGIDQSLIKLEEWPDLTLSLEGPNGPATLVMTPDTYWQFNAFKPGIGFFNIGRRQGNSILGLPLLNNYFTIFDRSASEGQGLLQFAPIAK
ncbi:MAG: pepsin-like aspartic protease, partial [Crocinitomicaceae bacterium]